MATRFTLTKSGTTYNFQAAQIPRAFFDTAQQTGLEELTTPGVAGRRWRDTGAQRNPFTVSAFAGYASQDLARTDALAMEAWKGELVTGTAVIDGVTYTVTSSMLVSALATILPGKFVDGVTEYAAGLRMDLELDVQ
jgi:hypothetical protein